MAVTETIYDNWGNFYEIDRTYDELIVSYEIETSAGVLVIDEPEGWGKVTFVHKRDKKYYGFNYEYTGSEFSLVFNLSAGMEEIEAEYAQFGSDGVVLFRRILNDGSTDYIEYEGRLNLATKKNINYAVECMVERKSLHQKINSRLNTKVNINSTEDLDQNPVLTYPYEFLALQGQRIDEKFESSKTAVRTENYVETRPEANGVYVFFDFTDPSVNTITDFFGTQLGVSGDINGAIGTLGVNIFKFTANGKYTFTVELDFSVHIKINPRFLTFGRKVFRAKIDTVIAISYAHPEDHGGKEVELYSIHSSPFFYPNTQNVNYPVVNVVKTFEDIEVSEGDAMTITSMVFFDHGANKLKSTDVNVTQRKAKLRVKGYSEQAPSFAEGRLIKSMIDALMWRVTGVEGNVKSNFYSLAGGDQMVDGCGSNRIILNGASIRSAPYTKFPLTTSISDMLTSTNAIDGVGMGYEWDSENEREIIRIEPVDYFFNDVEILEIESIFDFQQEVAADLIYNQMEFGYDKYKEENENSYDEIHAYHEYQTPIKNDENKYLQKSKYNASGYLIEMTRRVQFLETPQDTTTYDDDIFIVHSYLSPGPLPIWAPVTTEPFDQVDGIIDPDSTVNLTLSPKRMLMAHSRWIMSSLRYKDAAEVIKCTFVKQNKEFTTTLKADYCKRGDESLLPLRADADVLVGALRPELDGIYSPEWVTFKTRMPMNKVRYLMNALRGLSPDDNNYGYVSYVDDNEIPSKGWVYEISYNRDAEEVSFKLLKKKIP